MFTHRTTIETDSPIVRAAYEIAVKAHMESGQGRGKVWPGTDKEMPYIVHPIMLYDLMVHFGEMDEITLAGALLHDAKEDYEPYQESPDLMRQELSEKLKSYSPDHEKIAYKINQLCDELTNDREMCEGKRTWQIEHAGRISLRACKIKIFDQMSSVLDSIICRDDLPPGQISKGNRWSRSWSYKALDLVKAIAEERPQLNFLRCMFKSLFKINMDLIDADKAHAEDPRDTRAADIRAAFSFDAAEEQAHEMERNPSPFVPPFATLDHRRALVIENGIPQVKFTQDGKISHYANLTDPVSDRNEMNNETAIQLLGALEESDVKRRVSVGRSEVVNGRYVRINYIQPPITADEFIALAKDSLALEKSFATAILDKSRQLAAGISPA